ncbi:MAG: 2-oxoglutarate dehydrogenase E1 component [Bacilli bacterium]
MDGRNEESTSAWRTFSGPNLAYALELYERYRSNPETVDESARAWFARAGSPPETLLGDDSRQKLHAAAPAAQPEASSTVRAANAAQQWLRSIRAYGHLAAHVNPLTAEPPHAPELDSNLYAMHLDELRNLPARAIWPDAPESMTAREAVAHLEKAYTGSIGYEFSHVHNAAERAWLHMQVETTAAASPAPEERRSLLARLIQVDAFEQFLSRTFVGQKRFSIEGVDALVPMLDELIHRAAQIGAGHILIGMAHRGRLNVLAHVLGKPYETIFSEFHTAPNKELTPSEGSMGINHGWTGDVKYHLGASRLADGSDGLAVRVILSHNPSHLEFVNPVVEGFARAHQERRDIPGVPVQDPSAALAILIHGDAAFPGEGVVAETLNLSKLPGYHTGGAIHLIVNNQLGFTAEAAEGRSTHYASDLAKGFEMPVAHVNADDPEACLRAVQLAHAYRRQFHKSFLIDLIGYRRFGHNETDDPSFTQPLLYGRIADHPRIRALYQKRLEDDGVITGEAALHMAKSSDARLREAHEAMAKGASASKSGDDESQANVRTPLPPATAKDLRDMSEAVTQSPDGFSVYPKLERIKLRRRDAFAPGGKVDFALAETLAFAAILSAGIPIRLTGQDSQRGTFSQRHLVWHDSRIAAAYCPLQHLAAAKASFAVFNSPLSEAAVLGFEYGYSVQAPRTLVLWEAQFGDFANAGQVIIDQFIAAGQSKWQQESGLTLLLPHGYEGQGPDHSSARVERFLQLSAERNWIVANPTTAAQYYHLIREQANRLFNHPQPLIVMTQKSLLRSPDAASSVPELTAGGFQPVMDSASATAQDGRERVTRIILCSGKLGVELIRALRKESALAGSTAVVRLERLYPFPRDELQSVLNSYPNATDFVWAQEEPENMGAWRYARGEAADLPEFGRLRYVGRPARSSTAEGLPEVHQREQSRIIGEALHGSEEGGRQNG